MKVYSLNSLIFYKEMDKCLELSNMSLKQDTVDDISSSPTLFSTSINMGAGKAEEEKGEENGKKIKEWGKEQIN